MKIAKEICIIMGITLISEYLNSVLPFPIPPGVYGMVILLICLCIGLIKLESIETSGMVLLEIMPILFIPAGVGLINFIPELKQYLIPLFTIIIISTIMVMVVTGKTAEFILRHYRRRK